MARNSEHRVRWAAFGAAVAVTLGAGIIPVAQAVVGSGDRNVFVPITPCRLVDTRGGSNTVGPRDTPLGIGESYEVVARGSSGNCNLPSDATAIATNTTVTGGTAASFLAVYPADKPRPQASNLNWTAGQAATPNQVTVGLSANGRIRVYNDQGLVNVIVDVVGYYAHHHHDDRYYTKAQIDARPSAGVFAAGRVTSAGAPELGWTALGQWTSSRLSTGTYQLSFPNFTNCVGQIPWPVLVASPQSDLAREATPALTMGVVCTTGQLSAVVHTRTDAGALIDAAFTFMVLRDPAAPLGPPPATLSSGETFDCTTLMSDGTVHEGDCPNPAG